MLTNLIVITKHKEILVNKLATILIALLPFLFSFKGDKDAINPNRSSAPFIEFYLNTDSIMPSSYETIDTLIKAYKIYDPKKFHLIIIPIISDDALENSNKILRGRINKLKSFVKVKSDIQIQNTKIEKKYSRKSQWPWYGVVHGFRIRIDFRH